MLKPSRLTASFIVGLAAIAAVSPVYAAKVRTVTLLSRSAGSELAWYKTVAAAFEKAHPDMRVKLIYADSESYDTKLMSMIIAGQSPDVWTNLGNSGFMDFMARKFVLDLTPYINREKYDFKDYMTMAVKPFVIKGKTMGISHSTYSSCTYYNTDFLKEAGLSEPTVSWTSGDWTWDKMTEYARRLTLDKNNDGRPERFGITANFHLADCGLPWLFGGELFNESVSRQTGYPTKSTINTAEVFKAYEAKADLVRKKLYGGDFAVKTCAMLCDATWVMDSLTKAKKLNWSVAPLPKVVANDPTLYVDPWIIFSRCKNPDVAWALIKFMCSKEMQEQWVETTGRMPSRKSVMPKFLTRHPVVPAERLNTVLIGSFEVGRQSLWNFTVNSNQYIRVVDPLVQKIWQGKLSVDQAMRQADDAVTKVIKTLSRNLTTL